MKDIVKFKWLKDKEQALQLIQKTISNILNMKPLDFNFFKSHKFSL